MHISLDSALGQQRRLNSVGESITQIAPNPAAAYSLRSLTGGDPKVVRVRRESDNTERDFTASGVSSGALVDFVNAQTIKPLDTRALNSGGSGDRDGDFQIASAAYSLRSLGDRQATVSATGDTVTAADGKYVVQVRRSSDDTIKSFTADEVTDGTLVAFVGSGNDGFVRTWYDQSVTDQGGGTATGNHAVQATAASQPKIVSSGSLVSGGLDFDGTNDFLPIPLTGHNIGNLSSFCVGKFDSASGNSDVMLSLGTANGNSRWYAPFGSSSNIRYGYGSASNAIAEFAASTDVKIHTIIAGTTIGNASGFENGTLKGTATRVTTTSAGTIGIGGIDAVTDFPLDGKVQEVIVYESDQSANRGAYEGNIADHYGITGVPTGANTVNGFVETWYDQSGNGNDVTQTTSGKQPKIVSSGSLVTVNSKASFKFDRTGNFLERETYTQGTLTQPNNMFAVAKLDVAEDTNRKIVDSHLSTARNVIFLSASGSGEFGYFSGVVRSTGDTADANQHLFTALFNSTSSVFRIDGTQEDTGDTGSKDMTGIIIGANHDTANNFWDGDIQELIIYNSNQTSNFTALETNINSHYSIF